MGERGSLAHGSPADREADKEGGKGVLPGPEREKGGRDLGPDCIVCIGWGCFQMILSSRAQPKRSLALPAEHRPWFCVGGKRAPFLPSNQAQTLAVLA